MHKTEELGRLLVFFTPIFALTAGSLGILQYLSGVESVIFPSFAYAAMLIPTIATPHTKGTKLMIGTGVGMVIWIIQSQHKAELPVVSCAILACLMMGLLCQKVISPAQIES